MLYRKELRENIEKFIPYIFENDNTLLGTRSGTTAVSSYFLINFLGKEGFKKIIHKSFLEKQKFTKLVINQFTGIEITGEDSGVSLGLVNKKPLSKGFLDKWGLFAKKNTYHFDTGKEDLYVYKASFLFRNR